MDTNELKETFQQVVLDALELGPFLPSTETARPEYRKLLACINEYLLDRTASHLPGIEATQTRYNPASEILSAATAYRNRQISYTNARFPDAESLQSQIDRELASLLERAAQEEKKETAPGHEDAAQDRPGTRLARVGDQRLSVFAAAR